LDRLVLAGAGFRALGRVGFRVVGALLRGRDDRLVDLYLSLLALLHVLAGEAVPEFCGGEHGTGGEQSHHNELEHGYPLFSSAGGVGIGAGANDWIAPFARKNPSAPSSNVSTGLSAVASLTTVHAVRPAKNSVRCFVRLALPCSISKSHRS